MKKSGWDRSLLLLLACTVVGCQSPAPTSGNAVPAGGISRPAAGMGVIRGKVSVDAGLISAGSQMY
ncbi:MAG: hypothetical protein VKN33_04400, partial [Candidatus Sericytochromatia bacterium]|nr:hypothetical protein [Candidatus Sericytochromatia bacterium]